jgi:hypothetical protein
MPISSFSAPSAIAKPGVVANAAARPASPYDGQVIYQQDTDQAYVWNGSAWVLLSTGTANPPGLELVKTQTIGTAVSSVAVSSAFSADHDAYKIVISGGTGSAPMDLQLSLTGSSTGYYSGLMYVPYGSVGVVNAQGVGSANAASWVFAGNGGTSTLGMNVDLNGPYLAKVTGMSGGDVVVNTSGSVAFTNGYHNVATSYTGFTVTASTGTMTGGTITVYGYRKA